ncbi:unnamed protein product [Brassica rapa subsp. trilocularis]
MRKRHILEDIPFTADHLVNRARARKSVFSYVNGKPI